ncbi:MAG: type III-B CRISPR module-associated protein Cmr5 [Candidatus Binatia bacterium]
MAELRTAEQDRLAQALMDTGQLGKETAEKYFNDAARFGPLVVANGLAGAFAFAAEKFKSEFKRHLEVWICGRQEFKSLQGVELLTKLADSKCDAAQYRRMTQEALIYTNWLKRLSGAKKG